MPSFSAGFKLLFSPQRGWGLIGRQTETPGRVFVSYVLPLLLLGTLACLVGYGFVGFQDQGVQVKGVRWGIWFALRFLLTGTLLYWSATFVIDRLAVNFSCDTAVGSTAQLVSGAATPLLLASICYFFPPIVYLIFPALYSGFLLHTGLSELKKTRPENHKAYLLTSLILCTLLFLLLKALIGGMLSGLLGNPFPKESELLPGNL